MVGLSDVPIVGKTIDRIADVTVEAVFRGLKYIFCYKALVEVLNSEIDKVNTEEARVSTEADAARADGKIVYVDLLKWKTEVKEIKDSAKELLETHKNRSSWRCIQCLHIPNPLSRFRLGREAVLKAGRVSELTALGKNFLAGDIAFIPPFSNYESRKDAYEKLWKALKTETSPLVHGIYGMPGVGKTQMMQQIWQDAMEQKIFDKVLLVRSDMSDVKKIQDQIANHLDCCLESDDNVELRAFQLKSGLLNGGKILVIFDDVWGEIPLDIVGIPWGDGSSSMGCKILLTSRMIDVCLMNNCKHPVKITFLTADEAWDLFKNTVGGSQIDNLQDDSLAKKVCNKCSCNPLIIRAVGKALKFKSQSSWIDALYQLEQGAFEKIPGVDPQIYASVELSIDRLPEDAKLCLFVCSFFPDDAVVHIRKLIQVATGLQLVPGGEARVCTMVEILRSSSLLLDCRDTREIKLHYLIRDAARSIAAKDPKYAFLIAKCGSRLPDIYDFGSRKLVRLDIEKNNLVLPADLVCPDVFHLWLQCNKHVQRFSTSSFCIFVNLRFLLIQECKFSSLEPQFFFQPLSKLSTLILDYCDMTDINQIHISFFPKNLETLRIWQCDLPVPLDLPNLKHLRVLEIYSRDAVVMVPKSISRLSSLRELHVRNGFQFWDVSTVTAPLLDEISKLASLTSLQMFFKDSEALQDKNIFSHLLEYNICVGEPGEGIHYLQHSWALVHRRIELYNNQLQVLTNLIERAEEVKLVRNDINVSSIVSNNREAFDDLRNLYIEECNTMECLARISEDNIQNSHQRRTSFYELTTLGIFGCSAMKYLFSNSVAKCLMKLRELRIENCPKMEVIVMTEGTSDEGEIINFSDLRLLKLVGLPRLTSFYGHNYVQFHPLFDEKVVFPSLEELHIEDLENTSDVWVKHDPKVNASFSKLKSLRVSECSNLKIVIPPAMFSRLQNLESLSIGCCSSVISEVGTYGSNAEVYPLEALRAMDLESLPCLTETKLNSRENSEAKTWYPNLENLRICDCNSLRNVFLSSTARDLMHLKKMRVVGCKKMTEIIGVGKRDITAGIIFREMTDLQLTRLPNLTSIWDYQSEDPKKYKARSFTMFANLRFLALTNSFFDQQFCLRTLSELRSLLLQHCNMFETNVGFFPENLETLCIWDCRLPEELYLRHLKCLRTLEIVGGTSEVVAVPHNIYDNLHEFDIRMGRPRCYTDGFEPQSTKLIELSGDNQFKCFEGLVGMAEEVTLRSTNGTLTSIRDSNREAFAHLTYMELEECRNLEHIANISHDEIQPSLQQEQPTSFSKLTILYISRCSEIKYLFCGSIAKCLLQQLRIYMTVH